MKSLDIACQVLMYPGFSSEGDFWKGEGIWAVVAGKTESEKNCIVIKR